MIKRVLLFLFISSAFQSQGQIISNLISGFNIEKGVIEISFDFNSDNYQPFDIVLKLKQLEDNLIIEIPKENIKPSLERVYPGDRKKIEVSLENLTLEGEFIAILNPITNQSEISPLPAIVVSSAPIEKQIKELKPVTIFEPVEAKSTAEVVRQKTIRVIPGFSIKAKNFTELGALIKSYSEKMMINGDLSPNNVFIDFKNMSFSCDFKEENAGFIKIGLYYGTIEKGCESCMNVLLKNTDSIVIKEISYSKYIFNLIAIHK